MEMLSGSGSLPDGDLERVGGSQSDVHVVVYITFVLSYFNHSIISLSVSMFFPPTLCCVSPLCFSSEVVSNRGLSL